MENLITPLDIFLQSITSARKVRGIKSDRQLCLFLGVEPSLWSRIKRGLRPMNEYTLAAITQKLPEVRFELITYLTNRDNHEPT